MSMDFDSLQARIEHEIAELRGAFPRVASCESALVQWSENEQARYSLGLDIRWPQHQSLVSGPAEASAEAAVGAAFRRAREELQRRFG
ncbi:MAG TPA: hypothetical protein VFC18_14765 [Burkholderiales bacterium]|nr:hypothetical protein [Burkholderiales bacterium]